MFTGRGEVKMTSENMPDIKEHEVRIKVYASLISPGTEMANVTGLRATPDLKAPDRVFGYANAGEIIKVKGDVKGLKAGMRVAAMGGTSEKGRNSKKDFIQFLYIARGSINETVTLLIIFNKLGWIDTATFNSFISEGEEISKMLNGLINSIKETMN